MMSGVPGLTSSRVLLTLPGRPREGNRPSFSTPWLIDSSTRAAAAGLSRAMYSVSAIRLATAARNHLTCTLRPLRKRPFYFLVGGEVSPVCLQGFNGLLNLPIVECHILANGFGRHK